MCLIQKSIFYGAVLLFLAVLFGAFGAHALSATLEENNRIDVFATASQYHFYHGLALIIYGLLLSKFDDIVFQRIIFICFLFGVSFFSGSLYLLAIFNLSWLGAIAPVGGTLMLLGWALLAYNVWVVSRRNKDIGYVHGS